MKTAAKSLENPRKSIKKQLKVTYKRPLERLTSAAFSTRHMESGSAGRRCQPPPPRPSKWTSKGLNSGSSLRQALPSQSSNLYRNASKVKGKTREEGCHRT